MAALAPLLAQRLPSGEQVSRDDPVRLLAQVRAAIGSTVGWGRPLVFVDDLPLLDPLSAVVLCQVQDSGDAVLLATVRTGDPLPETYHSWWSRDGMVKFDIDGLTEQATSRVLSQVLAGPVAGRTVSRFHEMSGGIPLHLKELVGSAIGDGSLRRVEGVWQLTAGLIRNPVMAQMLADRLDRLTTAGAELVRRIAVCQPMELNDLPDAATEHLVELETSELIEVDQPPGAEWQVRLAHPAYADLIRAQTSRLHVRTLLLDQAARVKRRDRGGKDVVRLAMWELEATGRGDPAVLTAAARLARECHEFELVRPLADAAVRSAPEPDPEALLLLGESLRELGNRDAAVRVLDRATTATGPAALRARIAVARAGLTGHGYNDPDRAADILGRARDESAAHAAAMSLARSVMLVIGERAEEAVRELDGLDLQEAVRPEHVGLYCLAAVGGLLAVGQPDAALQPADELLPLQRVDGNLVHDRMPTMLRAAALLDLHGPDRALPAAAALRQCLDSGIDRLVCYGASQLFSVQLAAGRVRTAARWAREVISVARSAQHHSFLSLGMSSLAVALAMAGDVAAARQALDALTAEQSAVSGSTGRRPSWEIGAHAWTLAAAGEIGRARELLADGATAAADRGQWPVAAALWHDTLRLGDARAAAVELGRVAARCSSPLVAMHHRHAIAAVAGDPDGLAAVAQHWAATGRKVLAAEAFLAAATAARGRGSARTAGAFNARAADSAACCQGAATPGLSVGDPVDPLSRREREIAALAAQGLRSREITASLVASIRTVDNHLQAVYGKLGITGRRELADALRI